MLYGCSDPDIDVPLLAQFQLPRFTMYHVLCDLLEGEDGVTEAIVCFRRMQDELAPDAGVQREHMQWELGEWWRRDTVEACLSIHTQGFKQRCRQRLERLADVAMHSQHHAEAADSFSTMILLDPEDRAEVLIRRSRARAMMNTWEDALNDADEVYFVSRHRG